MYRTVKTKQCAPSRQSLIVALIEMASSDCDSDPPFAVRPCNAGLGVFATRDIGAGNVIMAEAPTVMAPKSNSSSSDDVCVECCRRRREGGGCAKGCGLYLCLKCRDRKKLDNHTAEECQLIREGVQKKKDMKKLQQILGPLRLILISKATKN